MKTYESVEIQHKGRYTFQRCHAGDEYTGFNMGGGESAIISLLHLLQRMPNGGLLVVEEIEAGLHPQAQIRLAKALIDICVRKRLQIICSTHSEIFLDALPRQARLLLRRVGAEHEAYESPSTRFAMYEMAGELNPELIIYCEDLCAAILIEETLPQELRLRVQIRDIGSDATVIRQGVSHIRAGFQMRSLCVLDGDSKDADITQWINSERGGNENINPDYMKLPGNGLPPERWVVAQLEEQAYVERFADQFGCTVPEAQGHIQALTVEISHHDIGYSLHQRTNIDGTDCIRRTMRSVGLVHPQLDELRQRVQQLLI